MAAPDVSLLNLVAHEMRAPLTLIRGYASMLREDPLDDVPRALDAMERAAEELDGLAEMLITAARLESAEIPCRPAAFDVADAVETACRRIQTRARLERAVLVVQPADRVLVVTADRSHVTRILTNLLNNALTYSHRPARVAVEVRFGAAAEIAVHDGGVGIAPGWHDRIFERFSRYAEQVREHPAGVGLGLPISRELAVLNGGKLFLERSEPGQGSVFVLRLPLSHATEPVK